MLNGFFDNITNQCNYCGCGFHSAIKNGNITTNLTAQRVNNDYTHTLDNIIPYCRRKFRSQTSDNMDR